MTTKTNPKLIKEILERGTEEIIEKQHLKKKLESGEKLRVKHGIDPTGPKIHIGRAIPLRKLKQFQELGHQIVLILGTFTAQIGDASDKTELRKPLSEKEIKQNIKDYKNQLGKLLDMEKVEIRRNEEWLSDITLKKLLPLTMEFSTGQMIHRRNFKERWRRGSPIGVHELLYPILQAYDSVKIQADVEVGGSDQLFNLKIGRQLQKIFNQKPQDIITTQMLYGLNGEKMSTSEGNTINLVDSPKEIYGSIMSMKDELLEDYFKLTTDTPEKEIKEIKENIKTGKTNPKGVKDKLGRRLITMYHGKKEAEKAAEEFEKVFKKKGAPSEIPTFQTSKKEFPLIELLQETGMVSSKSEAKRLVNQKGVKINGEIKTNWQEEITLHSGDIIQVGKRKFIKVKIQK